MKEEVPKDTPESTLDSWVKVKDEPDFESDSPEFIGGHFAAPVKPEPVEEEPVSPPTAEPAAEAAGSTAPEAQPSSETAPAAEAAGGAAEAGRPAEAGSTADSAEAEYVHLRSLPTTPGFGAQEPPSLGGGSGQNQPAP